MSPDSAGGDRPPSLPKARRSTAPTFSSSSLDFQTAENFGEMDGGEEDSSSEDDDEYDDVPDVPGLASEAAVVRPSRVSFRHQRSRRATTTLRAQVIKEGFLMKKRGRKGWHKRWVSISGGMLLYSKTAVSPLIYNIDLNGGLVAEESARNEDHGFVCITEVRKILLRAEDRKSMVSWMEAFQKAASIASTGTNEPVNEFLDAALDSNHCWYLKVNKSKYCNVCNESLPSVKKSLACEVCKVRVHKKCAGSAANDCKWTTLPSVPTDAMVGETMHTMHQWVRGNLASNSKCDVCNKHQAKKMEGYRCLWCLRTVHGSCRLLLPQQCDFGRHVVSILPPTAIALNSSSAQNGAPGGKLARLTSAEQAEELAKELDFSVSETSTGLGGWTIEPPPNSSPLLVFINTKSGGNHGVVLMRMFKGLLNPVQVFDLHKNGPGPGLKMMLNHEGPFRALGCGGDGTIGWILQEADKLGLKDMQLGVLPLGTGNDLARVLGWGGSFEPTDMSELGDALDKVEKSTAKLFDRWSITVSGKAGSGSAGNRGGGGGDDGGGGRADIVGSLDARTVIDRGKSSSDELKFMTISRKNPLRRETLADHTEQAVDADASGEAVKLRRPKSAVSMALQRESVLSADAEAVRKAYSTVKRLGRMIEFFLHGVEKMFAGEEDTGTEQLSDDDLSGMVEDFIKSCHTLHDSVEVSSSASEDAREDDGLLNRCDLLEEAVTAFLAMLYEESASDDDAQDTLAPLAAALTAVTDAAAATAAKGSSSNAGSYVSSPASTTGGFGTGDAAVGEQSGGGGTMSRQKPGAKSFKMLDSGLRRVATKLTRKVRGGTTKAAKASAAEAAVAAAVAEAVQGEEISVMNNYFGIGLDAKVALDFDEFRNENPEKCRSRMKNQMWYTVMGTRELLNQSCKKFEKRIKLECDGVEIKLPTLQGIVILNIGSYAAGANFWGSKVQKKFKPPCYDDGLLEVLSIKGMSQMAASKTLPGVSPTRIAQAAHIRITILPGDNVPIQVDGEAWMIEPCVLNIRHKRRVQMLCRDKAFQKRMLKWESAQKVESRQFLADLTEAKDALVDSALVAMMNSEVQARLAVFVAAVKKASATLEKASGKGNANKSHVVTYLSVIASLVEALRSCFDFSVDANDSAKDANAKEKQRRSWTGLNPVGDTVAGSMLSLSAIDDGAALQENLYVCEDALASALELCDDDPALFAKHEEVVGSSTLPRPNRAHTVGAIDSRPKKHSAQWDPNASTESLEFPAGPVTTSSRAAKPFLNRPKTIIELRTSEGAVRKDSHDGSC